MTTTPTTPAASQQAAVAAALLVLKSMGLSVEDLTAVPGQRPTVPTFADYVPVVSAAVTDGTRKAYGSYWKRVDRSVAAGTVRIGLNGADNEIGVSAGHADELHATLRAFALIR